MIYKHMKMSIPEYRSKKETYELLGYKEEKCVERGYYVYLTFSLDDNAEHYFELRKLENEIYRKGPPFWPIIGFVAGSFILLSLFIGFLSLSMKRGTEFDLLTNCLGFLLPAFLLLLGCVFYTYFYFSINKKIIDRPKPTKEEVVEMVKKIKGK